MLYFSPKPNFKQLAKHYKFPHTTELMEQYHSNGYDIVLNHVYTDEAVAELEAGFNVITTKYDLIAHYDNLMFLALSKIGEHEAILDELYFQFDQRKRTKELAQLLLAFTESPSKQYGALVFKTLKHTVKVTDKTIIQWVASTLVDAIQSGKMKANDFEHRLTNAFFEESANGRILSVASLALEAERKVELPTAREKASLANICFHLYPYLVNETNIKPDHNKLFSDAMLNFYFDLLVLFKYINPDKIASESKDYMGTLLKNRIKQLNTDYQGNKRK